VSDSKDGFFFVTLILFTEDEHDKFYMGEVFDHKFLFTSIFLYDLGREMLSSWSVNSDLSA
jgi:hypothetical protein